MVVALAPIRVYEEGRHPRIGKVVVVAVGCRATADDLRHIVFRLVDLFQQLELVGELGGIHHRYAIAGIAHDVYIGQEFDLVQRHKWVCGIKLRPHQPGLFARKSYEHNAVVRRVVQCVEARQVQHQGHPAGIIAGPGEGGGIAHHAQVVIVCRVYNIGILYRARHRGYYVLAVRVRQVHSAVVHVYLFQLFGQRVFMHIKYRGGYGVAAHRPRQLFFRYQEAALRQQRGELAFFDPQHIFAQVVHILQVVCVVGGKGLHQRSPGSSIFYLAHIQPLYFQVLCYKGWAACINNKICSGHHYGLIHRQLHLTGKGVDRECKALSITATGHYRLQPHFFEPFQDVYAGAVPAVLHIAAAVHLIAGQLGYLQPQPLLITLCHCFIVLVQRIQPRQFFLIRI